MQAACQIQTDQGAPPLGFDRIYLGERFCVPRYISRLASFVETAGVIRRGAWLATPFNVHEKDLAQVVELTLDAADKFEGILAGDPGLARMLKGQVRLVLACTSMNIQAALQWADKLGAEMLRLFPPPVDAVAAIAPKVPLEIVVHGHIPLAVTPRCLEKAYIGCEECGNQREVDNGILPAIMKGNALYAGRVVKAFGLIKKYNQLGVKSAVIEGFNLDNTKLESLRDIYKGSSPAPDNLVNGLFYGSETSGIDSPAWLRRFDASGEMI